MVIYTIYEIVCKDENIKDCYIGSTKNFDKRKFKHNYNCKTINDKNYNLQVYKFIRNNGGWKNWDMKVIEEIECKTKTDAVIKEQYYIQTRQTNNMNTIRSYVSKEKKILEHKRKQFVKNLNKKKKLLLDIQTKVKDKTIYNNVILQLEENIKGKDHTLLLVDENINNFV